MDLQAFELAGVVIGLAVIILIPLSGLLKEIWSDITHRDRG